MQLHYEKIDGILPENTLFIHGNLASNRWWYPSEREYRHLHKASSPKGAMILAEIRGSGKSTPPKLAADLDMHVIAEDFIALVESLGLGRIHLVGHSAGGFIAALMLAKAPQLFGRTILLDPVGPRGVKKIDDKILEAYGMMRSDKKLMAAVIGATIFDNDPQSDFFRQVVVEDAFQALQAVGPWVVQSLDGLDIREEVSQIKGQVLVLHGEHDMLLPLQDSREMAGLMENARFEVIPGQGHCTNAENPAKFAEISSRFLF